MIFAELLKVTGVLILKNLIFVLVNGVQKGKV